MVSDIPAGDGKMANLFLQCIIAALHYKCRKNLKGITQENEQNAICVDIEFKFHSFFSRLCTVRRLEGIVSLGFSNLYFCLFNGLHYKNVCSFLGRM